MENKQPETESTPFSSSPFAQVRRRLALSTGKLAQKAGRFLNRSGGSSLPGLLAGTIDPSLLRTITQETRGKRVLISGSNGKTTTAHLLATYARKLGLSVIFNQTGANMLPGVLSSVISHANLNGDLDADLLLFEVDEAVLAQACHEIKPDLVVLTNLFRDQQERHRDPFSLAEKIEQALAILPESSTVWLNCNDPLLANIGKSIAAQRRYFGLLFPTDSQQPDETADTTYCPRCHHDLEYQYVYYSHLGHWSCPGCHWQMPKPDIFIQQATLDPSRPEQNLFLPQTNDQRIFDHPWWSMPLQGLHNLYNVCSALTILESLGLPWTEQSDTLSQMKPVFARMEPIPSTPYPISLTYIKNPVSCTVNLTEIHRHPEHSLLHLAVQNGEVDGHDFSWLWDVDFARFLPKEAEIVCSGDQATMVALRLKYAGVESEKVHLFTDHEAALRYTLHPDRSYSHIYTLATATSVQILRSFCVKQGWVKPFWEE